MLKDFLSYNLYNLNISLITDIVYVSLMVSFLSVLKSNYNLQEVDIYDHGLSAPKSPTIFKITSILWLAVVLSFRGGSIAMICVYIGHYFQDANGHGGLLEPCTTINVKKDESFWLLVLCVMLFSI